jgi:Leucine-rich repeat (LRR) protein
MQHPPSSTQCPTANRIPTDLVQNTAEYLGRVAGLLSFRGVSTEWHGAVSDAVGFLNGRCWTQLANDDKEGALWTSLRLDDAALVTRCAVLCLRRSLETLTWSTRCKDDRLPLRLLGESNTVLKALSVVAERDGDTQVIDFDQLRRCEALRELAMCNSPVTNASFARHHRLLSQLEKLDLSGCERLKAVSNLAPCDSLRELNLSRSGVVDLRGLECLESLETLDVTHARITDWSVLRQCPSLTALSASSAAYGGAEIYKITDSAARCLSKYTANINSQGVDLSCLGRCAVLRELFFHASGCSSVHFVEGIPTLEVFHLRDSHGDDLTPLAKCASLRSLAVINASRLTEEGLFELHGSFPALEKINLTRCTRLTSVVRLRQCAALREAILSLTPVTNSGIAGLECIPGLTRLCLRGCERVTSVSTLRHCPSLRELVISKTAVTAEGVKGLEEIGTLERLEAAYLKEVLPLGGCRSLRALDLSGSAVTDASVAALAGLPSLETLNLSSCPQLDDVRCLSESVSLRKLVLDSTGVNDSGITGLERIPSLTQLSLQHCVGVTNAIALLQSKSLRRLCLSHSRVTQSGIAGIQKAPALEILELEGCPIDDLRPVAALAALRFVKVRW